MTASWQSATRTLSSCPSSACRESRASAVRGMRVFKTLSYPWLAARSTVWRRRRFRAAETSAPAAAPPSSSPGPLSPHTPPPTRPRPLRCLAAPARPASAPAAESDAHRIPTRCDGSKLLRVAGGAVAALSGGAKRLGSGARRRRMVLAKERHRRLGTCRGGPRQGRRARQPRGGQRRGCRARWRQGCVGVAAHLPGMQQHPC